MYEAFIRIVFFVVIYAVLVLPAAVVMGRMFKERDDERYR